MTCKHAPLWVTADGLPWRPLARQHHQECLWCHEVVPFGKANDTLDVRREIWATQGVTHLLDSSNHTYSDAFWQVYEMLLSVADLLSD